MLGFYARELGRPVRWSETRTENMLSMPQGRAQVQHATIGGTRDGRITAYQLDVLQDAGAYPLTGSVLHMMTMRMTCGVYDIENVGFTGVSTVTNAAVDHRLPRCRATRGGGRDRAHGRPVRGRDRDRPRRGAPPQRDPDVPRGTHHRGRHGVRRRRLRPFARARARGRRLRRAARRAGRAPGGGRHGSARHRHRHLRRDHVRRRRFGVRRGRAPARRQPARAHRHDAVRAGSRDDVGDDRLRPHRRADRAHHSAARRHRRDPQRRADGRLAFGAARRHARSRSRPRS